LKGNSVAAKEIADRVEGRVHLPVEVETPENKELRVTIRHIMGRKERENDSQEKQAVTQDSAAIKSKPR
jgi:hypothetical protein